MIIIIQVESCTVDSNGLPVTFEVNVERSSLDNASINCSFNVTAKSNCSARALYCCDVDFAVGRCPQLLLQQEQESDYQIGIFAKTSIGRSSQTTTSALCKLDVALFQVSVYRLHVYTSFI